MTPRAFPRNALTPPEPDTHDGVARRRRRRPRRKKLAIDYLLEGERADEPSPPRAFAESTLPDGLRDDPNFKSWASIKSKSLAQGDRRGVCRGVEVPPGGRQGARGETRYGVDGKHAGRHDERRFRRVTVRHRDGPPLGDGTDVIFFDLCSGKGFTSVFLAHRYPKARVVMIDANKRMNLTHLESLSPRVTFHCLDLYSAETAALLEARDARVWQKRVGGGGRPPLRRPPPARARAVGHISGGRARALAVLPGAGSARAETAVRAVRVRAPRTGAKIGVGRVRAVVQVPVPPRRVRRGRRGRRGRGRRRGRKRGGRAIPPSVRKASPRS